MKTIAHISDLRFGREDPAVVAGLKTDLAAVNPSLLVVCGDLTHRAGSGQFRRARQFLASIPVPRIVVPGDRDLPLYHLWGRLFSPFKRFRRVVSSSLAPVHMDEEMTLYGINTARSWTWSRGCINFDQINSIKSRICPTPEGRYRVLVTHHPFVPPPGHPKAGIDYMGRWRHAVEVMDYALIDLCLAGHLPRGKTSHARSFQTDASFVMVQAGSATGRLPKGESNAYNLVLVGNERIEIRTRVWSGKAFEEGGRLSYWLDDGDWVKAI